MIFPTRPALRYYGGKWRLAKWILDFFPAHECYVEPYGGAASLLLQKPPSAVEVYNDLDGEVVNFFRVLRDRTEDFMQVIDATPYAREEYELSFESTDDPLERARRLFVRAWQGYGAHSGWQGSFRIVKDNKRGRSPVDDWLNNAHVRLVADRFKQVTIEHDDALNMIDRYDSPDTLFYCDPPYTGEERSAAHRYQFEMGEDDHRQLAGRLHEVQGMVVLSGYDSPLYTALYGDWERATKSAFTNGQVYREEVLWMNPACSQRRLPLFRGLE